jgi:hypothetical protein
VIDLQRLFLTARRSPEREFLPKSEEQQRSDSGWSERVNWFTKDTARIRNRFFGGVHSTSVDETP